MNTILSALLLMCLFLKRMLYVMSPAGGQIADQPSCHKVGNWVFRASRVCRERRVNRSMRWVRNRGSGEREKMRCKIDFLLKGLDNQRKYNVDLVDEGYLAELPWGKLKYQTLSDKQKNTQV